MGRVGGCPGIFPRKTRGDQINIRSPFGLNDSLNCPGCGGIPKNLENWLTISSAIVKLQTDLLNEENRNDGPSGPGLERLEVVLVGVFLRCSTIVYEQKKEPLNSANKKIYLFA